MANWVYFNYSYGCFNYLCGCLWLPGLAWMPCMPRWGPLGHYVCVRLSGRQLRRQQPEQRRSAWRRKCAGKSSYLWATPRWFIHNSCFHHHVSPYHPHHHHYPHATVISFFDLASFMLPSSLIYLHDHTPVSTCCTMLLSHHSLLCSCSCNIIEAYIAT